MTTPLSLHSHTRAQYETEHPATASCGIGSCQRPAEGYARVELGGLSEVRTACGEHRDPRVDPAHGSISTQVPHGHVSARGVRLARIADALAELDSHTVYDRGALAKLDALGIDVGALTSQTRREVFAAMVSRGLGGRIEDDAPDELYTGYIVSDEVVAQLGYKPAGRAFHGRGSAHRANIEQLRVRAVAEGGR